MNGVSWQWRDDGSGYGHIRLIASSTTYTAKRQAWRAFFQHSTDCVDCGHGETRCEEATKLLRVWRRLPS